jgi:hypothetical protein
MRSEEPVEAFEEQIIEDIYKTRFGDEGIERLRDAKKAKTGQMTYRQRQLWE